jgi:hypothetical protein
LWHIDKKMTFLESIREGQKSKATRNAVLASLPRLKLLLPPGITAS